MAISMTKWVDITSGSLPAGASDRELILRLITKSSGLNNQVSPDVVYECTSAADVLGLFGAGSDEYKIAQKYFGFISLSATKAQKISFWRPNPGTEAESGEDPVPAEDIVTSLTKMADTSDNFGTLMFVDEPKKVLGDFTYGEPDETAHTTTEANNVATWINGGNYRFRAVFHVELDKIATQTGPITWTKVEGAEDYLKQISYPCCTAVLDDAFANIVDIDGTPTPVSTKPGWLTTALLASTRYSRSNSTIIQEFKALNSADMIVTCKTDSLYNILTSLNVNFYGQTQKAGQLMAFYMEGYNLDGTDTSVCDNEIWLKDRITTEVFNRFVKCNKVPAGLVGNAMIKSAILGVISQGLNNLAVQPEKTIEDSDKAAIIQNTGDESAPGEIYTNGYYLDVRDGDTERAGNGKRRVVDYILYYSTGEGIRKVTGSHVMV